MSKTPSAMISLGSIAHAFSLIDVLSEERISLDKANAYHGTIIMFICNHCPYVKHIIKELSAIANEYSKKGFLFVAINSNDIKQYPEDSPVNMKKLAQEFNFTFPYVFDETQEVAKAYQAACTPDFFVFDQNLTLVYRGQFDDSRPHNGKAVTGESLTSTLECLLKNEPIDQNQKPSLGCNIKWKQ